jgi:pyrroloquinoline quinone biosynthesis protein A
MIGRNDRMERTGMMQVIRSGNMCLNDNSTVLKEIIMWTKPAVTEMRFGFEVTMYVCNR